MSHKMLNTRNCKSQSKVILFYHYSLMKFCMEHQKSDVLVYGISQSENPFKENKGCTLL